jgi:adenine-specific DNA-methyltransferase
MIHPSGIRLGQVVFPNPAVKKQYILPTVPSILQKNRNMLMIKRVPAKSDKKALFCGVYLASQAPRAPMISTHNKLNYIDYEDGREMDFNMVYGLFAVLNSSLYGKYYGIVSKSKQINASEFADLPLPSEAAMRAIGAKLAMSRVFSEKACDTLLAAQMKSGKL